MKRTTCVVAIFVLLLTSCTVFAQQSLQCANLSLRADESGMIEATSAFDPDLLDALNLRLYDGRSQEYLPLTAESATARGGRLTVTYSCLKPLAITVTFSGQRTGLAIDVAVTNNGDQQEWLAPTLEAELGNTAGLSVFDGRTVAVEPQERFGDDTFMGRLQICSAWNDRAGIALGLAADEIRSWLDHAYLPPAEGRPALLTTLTHVVLDPGQADTVSFWAASHPGDWGFREALDAYYRSYPEMFRRDPDVDPRVDLGGAQYRAWPVTRKFAPEICRRLYAGWEWCYAPFRRTGDIVGREEFWEYEPAREITGPRAMEREEYRQWRREQFEAGEACDVVMGFYVPAQVWCEEQLAREVYPDALIEDPNTRTLFTSPWVTGHDNERLVFPYKTSFGEQSRVDMAAVTEELDLRGFAFDTAGGNGKYRGPALPVLDGRAWDEDGVYCRNNVAVARLMQFVHTLHASDGTEVAVISNPNPRCAYSSVIWSDSMMLEGEPWKMDRTYGDSLRWMAGQKTLVWWEGYGPETFVDPTQASDEQVGMLMRGLADFTLLQSFRIGYIPPPAYTHGVGRLVEWLPALTDCVTSGWQPVTAARVPEPLWATRYGDGLESMIVVAHETADEQEIEVAIENERLADGAVLFTDYDGSERANTIVEGETRIALAVPTRTPVLLRARAEVLPADAITAATATAREGLTGQDLRLQLSGQGPATVRVRVPEEMAITSARYNGRPVSVQGDRIALRLAGDGELRVQMRSMTFRGTDRALLQFPFASDEGATSTIFLRDGAGEIEQYLAGRLSLYFDYWYGRIKSGEEPAIPIVEGEQPAAPGVVIRTGARASRVEVADGILYIEARDDVELKRVFMEYLRALDTRYWAPDLGVNSWLRRAKGDDPWLTWPEED